MGNAQDLSYPEIREAVQKLCAQFPGAYWQSMDRDRSYLTEFVNALTQSGFLSVLIPEQYGGSGPGLAAAAAVLEEIHRSGGNGGACHAQMYTMGTLLRHGSVEQKEHFLPKTTSGELRLQAFGMTEPTSGTDTTRITTHARREGYHYVVSGQKNLDKSSAAQRPIGTVGTNSEARRSDAPIEGPQRVVDRYA